MIGRKEYCSAGASYGVTVQACALGTPGGAAVRSVLCGIQILSKIVSSVGNAVSCS
jgi:hypothetical protein